SAGSPVEPSASSPSAQPADVDASARALASSAPASSAPASLKDSLGAEAPPAVAEPRLPEPESAGACPSADDRSIGLIVSPAHAVVGGQVRILAAAFSGEPLAVRIQPDKRAGGDSIDFASATVRAGLPIATSVSWKPDRAGSYRVVVGRQ